ncbi:neuronal membrane glycoprotein M6-b isoform X1 [Ixodes scapularis]|uniref:neuronal membrane glycoprotein M6-b isoform X1 n=1 Tax=Ixodes scapularis TaxID=6945 RepID=UPI001A9DE64D|nr:neuronal membrane glycoprotein M6-b isoform X1 [Ixodes scapularis]
MTYNRKSYSYSSISKEKRCVCCSPNGCKRPCARCLSRVPFATLVATVMCCAGVAIFLGAVLRAVASTMRMVEVVFKRPNPYGPAELQAAAIGTAVAMGLLELCLVAVGFLTTGPTRERLGARARVGGRLSCGLLIVLSYLVLLVWLALALLLVTAALSVTLVGGMCNQLKQEYQCLDFRQLEFLLPRDFPVYEANGKPAMQLCDVRRKEFCKDWVEQCGLLLWLAGGAALLALLGLVKHLMCLAANYAHLRDQQKLLDLQLLQDLQDTELTTLGSKDRF